MGAPLGLARAVLGGRARALVVLSVTLGVAARLALALGVVFGADASVDHQALFVIGIALVSATWTLTRVPLVLEVRRAVFRSLGRGLLAAPRLGTPREGEADLITAAFTAEAVLAHALPAAFGETISALAVGGLALAIVPTRALAGAALALVVTAAFSIVARRAAERAGDRAWEALHPLSALVGVLRSDGAALIANARAQAALASLELRIVHFARESRRSDVVAGLSGRLPLLLVGGAVYAVTALVDGHGTALRDALLVAALVPPFAGLTQAWVDLARSRASLASLPSGTYEPPSPRRLPPELTGLVVRYPGSTAEITCDRLPLPRGSMLLLEGGNGTGKSTVLRALSGLLPLASVPLLEPASERTLAYLPQGTTPPVGTVEAHLALWTEGAHRARAEALARAHGITLDRDVAELSAGQRRRVELCCVLTDDAEALLLDEPEQNLDAGGLAWLVAELSRLRAEGRRLVVASHAAAIRELADARVTPTVRTIDRS